MPYAMFLLVGLYWHRFGGIIAGAIITIASFTGLFSREGKYSAESTRIMTISYLFGIVLGLAIAAYYIWVWPAWHTWP